MISTNRLIARGASWMVLARLVNRSLGLASALVLVRILSPEDFGLVAMATAVLALLEVFTYLGLDTALIQNQSTSREHFDSAWTMGVILGAIVAAVLALLAYPASLFYADSRVMPLMLALAPVALVTSLVNIGCVQFRKEMRFDMEFRFILYTRVVGVIGTIVLALLLRNYWALILGSLVGALASVGVSYWIHPFRPRLSLARAGDLFHFSKWLVLNNVLSFAHTRGGDFIIGKLRGPRELGLYSIAYEFATLTTAEVIAPINRAAFPGYAKLASDRAELIRTFLKILSLIALIALPAGVGVALTAHLFVPVLLGSKWEAAIPLLALLALGSTLLALWTNAGYVFLALGEPWKMATLLAIQAFSFIAGLLMLLSADVPNAPGWAMIGTGVTMSLGSVGLLKSSLGIRVRDVAGGLWRPLLATGLMVLVVRGTMSMIGGDAGVLMQFRDLGIAVITGAATYSAASLVLWRLCGAPQGAERTVVDAVTRWMRGTFAKGSWS